MRSIYVVGDIHGCYDALLRLEQAIYSHAEQRGREPFIVSVGDLIDRGPDSFPVVKYIRKGVEAGIWAAVAGNHEACLFESLYGLLPELQELVPLPKYIIPFEYQFGRDTELYAREWVEFIAGRSESWLRQGGRVTMESFGGTSEAISSWVEQIDELRFLAELPILWENDNTIVSHALATHTDIAYGRRLLAGQEPVRSSVEHGERVHGLLWNRGYAALPADPQKMHISGHTPLANVARFEEERRIMIDTSCVYGNLLTAWCEDTDEVVQVPGQKSEW